MDGYSIQSEIDDILKRYISESVSDLNSLDYAELKSAEDKLYKSGNEEDIKKYEELHDDLVKINIKNKKFKNDDKPSNNRPMTPPTRRIPLIIDATEQEIVSPLKGGSRKRTKKLSRKNRKRKNKSKKRKRNHLSRRKHYKIK